MITAPCVIHTAHLGKTEDAFAIRIKASDTQLEQAAKANAAKIGLLH